MSTFFEKIQDLFRNLTPSSPTVAYNSSLGAFFSISVISKGLMQRGYGVVMTVTNVETNDSFTTKSLGRISPHSILENIPEGKYYVSKVEIPLGEAIYINQSPELKEFFGILDFKMGKAYYLGNFIGTRKIGRENVFHLKIENQSTPEKLLKKLNERGIALSEIELVQTYPYEKDELIMY